MKRYTIILLAAVLAVASCSRDAEKLFDKSAAVRAQETLEAADSALTQAPYGWEMIYFANPWSRGYNLLCSFNRNTSVRMTGKNELTTGNVLKTDSNSTWDVRNEYGPILSFDTYNEVLHAWADPENDPWGDGYLGDYEFLILRNYTDAMILKGKKHSAYSYLRRLQEPIAETDYYAAVESMLSTLFKNGNIVSAEVNGKLCDLYNGSNGIFWLTPHMEPYKEDELEEYPLCSTMDGIIMSWGLPGVKDERVYTLKDGILVGENGSKIYAGPRGDNMKRYVYQKNQGWTLDVNSLTGPLAEEYNKANAFVKSAGGKAAITAIHITYNVEQDLPPITPEDSTAYYHQREYVVRIGYCDKKGKAQTCPDYRCKLTSDGESITISDVVPHCKIAKQVETALPVLGELACAVAGTYQITSDDPLNTTIGITMSGENGGGKAIGSLSIKK